jgi:RimJ/RimL family protein N-acetyltransferase
VSSVIETRRLILRRFGEADLENLVALDADPEVMRFLNGGIPTPREVIRSQVLPRFMQLHAGHSGFGYWAAIEKATGEFLGWFGFCPRSADRADDVELGYRLRRSVWGKGYATEGARALIRKGFAELGVRRVFATTYGDNVASRRVMEKAGLRFVRAFRLSAAELTGDDATYVASADQWDGDDVEYALVKAEWEELPGAT